MAGNKPGRDADTSLSTTLEPMSGPQDLSTSVMQEQANPTLSLSLLHGELPQCVFFTISKCFLS